MSKLIHASIDVTSIPKEAIKPHSNGKKYLAVDIWINDEEDRFGNNCSLNISQSKEEREAKTKKIYIGNGKTKFGFDKSETSQSTSNKPSAPQTDDDDMDSIPF